MNRILKLYIISAFVMSLCSGQTATEDVDICKSQSKVRARVARIKSPNFPNPVKSARQCQCSATGTNPMDIIVKFLLSMQHSNNTPISVNYETMDKNHSWTLGNHGNLKVSEDNDIVIATNVSFAEVIFKTPGREETMTIFEIVIKAGDQDELSLNCSGTATANNSNSKRSSDKDAGGILPALEKLCSPYLVIILGSLSAALLLIILIVSIILCCVMPKKKKRFLDVIRRSRVINEDTKNKNKKDSVIYDEAFRKSQASFLDPGQLYSNDTFPAASVRQSGQHYMNSSVANTQYSNV